MSNQFLVALAAVPDSQADVWLQDKFNTWTNNTPTLEDITETRNQAAYVSACSDFVISVLNLMIADYDRMFKE